MTAARRGLRAAIIGLTGLGLAQCDRERNEPPAEPVSAPEPAAPPTPITPLTRAQMIAALGEAASAWPANAAGATIAGRTFEIVLPFGCSGPSAAEVAARPGVASSAWSEAGDVLRLRLAPADLSGSPVLGGPGEPPAWEGVDGYWIAAPWRLGDGCPSSIPAPSIPIAQDAPQTAPPVARQAAIPAVLEPLSMGLAVIRTAEDSRIGRLGDRAFEFSVRGESDRPPALPAGGYRLVLSGRVATFPDGRPIRCDAQTIAVRPVCLAAVQLDTVAFAAPTGERLSQWRAG